jgi:hypothetical protein
MKEVLPWLVRWALRGRYKRFLSCLAALVGPEKNIFFLTIQYFNSFFSIAQQGGQAVVPSRLSLNMCNTVIGTVYQVI